jgi:hypothetical protein
MGAHLHLPECEGLGMPVYSWLPQRKEPVRREREREEDL